MAGHWRLPAPAQGGLRAPGALPHSLAGRPGHKGEGARGRDQPGIAWQRDCLGLGRGGAQGPGTCRPRLAASQLPATGLKQGLWRCPSLSSFPAPARGVWTRCRGGSLTLLIQGPGARRNAPTCCTDSCAAGGTGAGRPEQQSEVRGEELARGAGRATEKGREGPWVLKGG